MTTMTPVSGEARAMGKPFATWGHRSGKVAKAPGPLCSDCQVVQVLGA